MGKRLGGWMGVALAVLCGEARAQCEMDALTDADATSSAQFGFSVLVDGDLAVVGQPFDDDVFSDAGSLVVFDRVGQRWVEAETILAPPDPGFRYLGSSYDLDGQRLVAGFPSASGRVFFSGKLLVFDRTGSGWEVSPEIQVGDVTTSEHLGRKVALEGDRIAALANRDVVVFELGSEGWEQTARISPPAPNGPYFPLNVALDAGRILITGGPDGAAYLYEEEGSSGWQLQATLAPTAPLPTTEAGYAVALDGPRAVLGAPQQNSIETAPGSVYVFEEVGGTWSQTIELSAPSPATHDGFGYSVALEGNRLAVGAPYVDDAGFDSGQAYLFELSGGTWQEQPLPESAAGPLHQYGHSVALSGEFMMAAAPLAYTPLKSAGAVSAWSLDGAHCPALLATYDRLSLAAGGSQVFTLDAGATNAFALAFLLGSATGTTPGVPVDGLTLPLNPDPYLTLTGAFPNTLIANSLSFLDADGRGSAQLNFAAGLAPSLAGIVLHHAYVALAWNGSYFVTQFTSNAEPLELIP